ncbi:MAG: amino acid ABC transporter substrate-binding protein, partial [Acidobacteria bacterium]|nr:amino acid ABC transporter substrate-binding protein [Acidobacteriota bacterium]
MFRRSRVGLLPMLLALALVVAACSSSDDTTTTTPTTTPEAAATTTTAAAATTTTEAVSTEPIKIAALTPLSSAGGPNFTPWGVQVNAGMQMAVDDINAAGGVDGRMLELIVADTQSNGVDGAAAFERVIEEGIVAAGGVISSDTGLATSRIAEEKSVPLFLVKAGSDAILTQDSRYTFRTCLPAAPMVAGPILQYAQSQGFTKVGAIIADYAWGQAMKSAMETAFATDDSIELQIEVAPVTESDFTTYLRSLEGFAPEMIVATGHPPGAGPITVQSADLGFD